MKGFVAGAVVAAMPEAFAHGVQTVTTDVPQKMLDEYKEKKR